MAALLRRQVTQVAMFLGISLGVLVLLMLVGAASAWIDRSVD
jgi:hypothetical protein